MAAVETARTTALASFALPLLLLLAAGGPRPCAAHSVSGDYRTLLNAVTNIMKQDEYWARAFDEGVYHRLDRGPYAYFVDKELMADARDETPATAADGGGDRGDAIRPMRFVRNVMHRRFRVGSVLDTAVDVLHKSLTCVAYKHAVHLITLIRVEIARDTKKQKAVRWSGKALSAVAGVVIKMAGLRRADKNLLKTAAIMDAYADQRPGVTSSPEKYALATAMDQLSDVMLGYIKHSCVHAPADPRAVAKELSVEVTPDLYNEARAMQISADKYKKMFKSIMDKMSELYEALPGTGSMSLDRWNEILHFKREPIGDLKRKFYRLKRN